MDKVTGTFKYHSSHKHSTRYNPVDEESAKVGKGFYVGKESVIALENPVEIIITIEAK